MNDRTNRFAAALAASSAAETNRAVSPALAATRRYFDENPNEPVGLCRADHMLAWLWCEGFKVGPL